MDLRRNGAMARADKIALIEGVNSDWKDLYEEIQYGQRDCFAFRLRRNGVAMIGSHGFKT